MGGDEHGPDSDGDNDDCKGGGDDTDGGHMAVDGEPGGSSMADDSEVHDVGAPDDGDGPDSPKVSGSVGVKFCVRCRVYEAFEGFTDESCPHKFGVPCQFVTQKIGDEKEFAITLFGGDAKDEKQKGDDNDEKFGISLIGGDAEGEKDSLVTDDGDGAQVLKTDDGDTQAQNSDDDA
eukprot:4438639-Pyramimonas_sp.AAC.1